MSEHTKGPWSACHNGECICKTVAAQDHPIASVTAGDWGDEPDVPYGHVPEGEATANARLIAAAPDMYEVCKAILAMRSDVAGMARAAIARVEGE